MTRFRWLATLIFLLTFSQPVAAQETTVSAPVSVNIIESQAEPTPTLTPTTDPTDIPVEIPTEPVIEPTEVPPTDVPQPTDPPATDVPPTIEDPTQPAATESPAATVTDASSPTPSAEPSPTSTIAATATATATGTATATATSAPEVEPVLTVTLDSTVSCTGSEPDQVPIDTPALASCLMTAHITGTDATNLGIALTWHVQGISEDGWQIDLRQPGEAWSGPSLDVTTTLQTGNESTINESVTFAFDVQAVPAGCTATPLTLTLSGGVDVTTPDHPTSTITVPTTLADGTITLPAAASAEPGLAFDGPLNLGEVIPSSFDTSAQTSGTITLIVSSLSTACGDWTLSLVGSTLDAANGDRIPAANLHLTAINGEAVPGGCSLDSGCPIATLTGGANQADSQIFVLDITLTIPAQTVAGSFSSSISASIEPAP